MTKEVQQRIFEKFVQGDSSTNRRFGGSGLGMTISNSIIEAMHGSIDVTSQPGVGSTFTVNLKLPIVTSKAETTAFKTRKTLKISRKHILVAEDNQVNQTLMRHLIERLDCTCDIVSNGAEAMEAVQSSTYDLVLMDCQMPEVDGYEATILIRQWEDKEDRSRLPIVALTADALDNARRHCFEVGMDDFLSKPMRKGELQLTLQKWLG